METKSYNRNHISEFEHALVKFCDDLFCLKIYITKLELKQEQGINIDLSNFLKKEFSSIIIDSQPLIESKLHDSC